MEIIVFLLVTMWQWAIKTFSKNWTRTVIFIGQRRFNHWENCVLYITNFYFSLLPRVKALKLFMPTANIKLYSTSWFFVTLLKLSLIEKSMSAFFFSFTKVYNQCANAPHSNAWLESWIFPSPNQIAVFLCNCSREVEIFLHICHLNRETLSGTTLKWFGLPHKNFSHQAFRTMKTVFFIFSV